jgi:hypothetical protein
MHNMIIEDDRGKDVDYSYYDLMGVFVQVWRREERMSCFIASYHSTMCNEVHDA